MVHSQYIATILATAILLPIFIGCGPSHPATAPVTGKITFQGKPVPEGTIMFYPEKGRSASARIQPDGTYALTTFDEGDGALLGNHEVTIDAVHFAKSSQPNSLDEELSRSNNSNQHPSKSQRITPQKYANRATSGLTAEVTSDSNTINFDLPN